MAGPLPGSRRLRAAAMAIVKNPFAGRYVERHAGPMDDLKPLGLDCCRAAGRCARRRPAIDGYGKGAIVGTAGEIEHGALWHVPGGYAMRELLGGAKAIVPSAKKVGAFGARLDVPLRPHRRRLCAQPFRRDGGGHQRRVRAPTRSCSRWP